MNRRGAGDDQGDAHERALGHVGALVRGVAAVLTDLDGPEHGERDAHRREDQADDQPPPLALTGFAPQFEVRDLGLELLDASIVVIHRYSPTQIGSGQFIFDLVGVAHPTDLAVHHDRSQVGDTEHGARELLDHEDRHAGPCDLRHEL